VPTFYYSRRVENFAIDHVGQIELRRLVVLCQPSDRYWKAVDVTLQTLVMEAVNQMMAVRKQKQVVIDESVGDTLEQQHSPDTSLTPTSTLPAPVSTSTPADVCICVICLCYFCFRTPVTD